jgi:hypothetical protein
MEKIQAHKEFRHDFFFGKESLGGIAYRNQMRCSEIGPVFIGFR